MCTHIIYWVHRQTGRCTQGINWVQVLTSGCTHELLIIGSYPLDTARVGPHGVRNVAQMVQSDWSLKTWGPTVKSWVYTDICVFPVYAFSFAFGKFPFSLESVLSLSIIKDLRSSFLIFTPKNSQFPKPQNLPQLLLILICFPP